MILSTTLSAIGLSTVPHSLVVKRIYRSKKCQPCGKRIKFTSQILKCSNCPIVCHPRCYHDLPVPCVSHKYPNPNGCSNMMVPPLLQQCVNEIEKRLEKNVYFLPSPNRKLSTNIVKRFAMKKASNLKINVHVLCETLKLFLLENPTIPHLHLQGLDKVHENQEHLISAFLQLPRPNRDTLAFILLHILHIADSPRAGLSLDDLSKIFSPYLTEGQANILEALLSLPAVFWLQSFQFSSVKKDFNFKIFKFSLFAT